MIALLAHQGGWDEILLVVGPIMLIGGFLLLIRRRLKSAVTDSSRQGQNSSPTS
jgi:nitrate reductase gamma subunit